MTHAEFRAARQSAPTVALEPCTCPGELEPVEEIRDPVDDHEVSTWKCDGCGAVVVWDETADQVRNEYRPMSLAEMRASLAAGMRAPG